MAEIREKGKIKKVSYMTKAEVKEILGEDAAFQNLDDLDALDSLDDLDNLDDLDDLDGLDDLDDLDDSKKTTIPVNISRIKDGAFIWLGTYKLSKGDQVYYNLSAKTGKRLAVGFAKPGQSNPTTTYMTISNQRTDGKLEIKSGAMKWGGSLTSGSYRLFVHTTGGDVTKVKGSITIAKATYNL